MIENRFRLEQQIFLGRQAVRRAMQARGQASRRGEAAPQGRLPEPSTGTRLPLVAGTPLVSALSEGPLPMDTDAEAAYLSHAQREEQRTVPLAPVPDARRTPGGRRRRVQSVVEHIEREGREEERRSATLDVPPAAEARHASGSHGSPVEFLRRLGTGSPFSTFASLRRNKPRLATDSSQETEACSGDSSSDDDDLSIISRRQRHPSAFDLRADFERRYPQVVEDD